MMPMTPWLFSNYGSERMGFKFTVNINILTTLRCSEVDILRLIFPFDRQTNTLHAAATEVAVTLYITCIVFEDTYRTDNNTLQ